MYLNKTEKLLFFFVVFLNFIPLNKAQAHSRGKTYSKTIDWVNKSFLKRKQSLNITLNKSFKNTINTYQRNLISEMELEINYSGNKKESKFNNQKIQVEEKSTLSGEVLLPEFDSINKSYENNDFSKSEEENKIDNKGEIEIRSDSQSEKGGILYANGNVLVVYKDNILNADQISYDKQNKIINANGNVIFLLKNDIFIADSINYDFSNERGNLANVKGFINTEAETRVPNFEDFDLIPEEILSKLQREKILYTPSKIKNWIFSTDELIIFQNKWFAQKAIFTNDLFESDQVKFKINSLEIIVEDSLLRLKSGLNYLVIEDKVSIPFWFTEQIISTSEDSNLDFEESINRWNISYDKLDKDGYFIGRKFDEINLFGNYKLQLEPQYFIQRSIQGYSKSFIEKDHSITSEKVKRNANIEDFFGLESKIVGKIWDWNHKIESTLNTFDFQKFPQAARSKMEFSKKINLFDDIWNNKFYWVYRDRVWNGSQGESEIYGGYGWQLDKSKSWNIDGIAKNNYLGFGFGRFTAEELKSKDLTTSFKGNIFYKYDQRFPIFIEEPVSKFIDQSFLYLPEPIQKGIFLDTEFSALSNLYKNGNHQEYLRFGSGPEFLFGDFKNSAFDYTRLRLFPFYTIASGESIFKFDQISDQLALDINFDQHLLGPLLIKTYGRLNLNSSSKNYGKFISSKISINWKRRSYEFGVFYKPNERSGGIQFSLFGFK